MQQRDNTRSGPDFSASASDFAFAQINFDICECKDHGSFYSRAQTFPRIPQIRLKLAPAA